MNFKRLSPLSFLLIFTVACNGNIVTQKPEGLTPSLTFSQEVDPDAGKVSLWDRTAGYDAAVFLPADYGKVPNKKYPLVISLHGPDGSVLNTEHTKVEGRKAGFIKNLKGTPLAEAYNAIVIAPNWAPAGSNARGLWVHTLLKQLVVDALKKFNIDQHHIVTTGHTISYLRRLPLRFPST